MRLLHGWARPARALPRSSVARPAPACTPARPARLSPRPPPAILTPRMDTLTQMALGAAVGQAGFHRRFGRRAALFGAVGGLLPDLDVVPIAFMGPLAEWRYHRGISHALWVGLVLG